MDKYVLFIENYTCRCFDPCFSSSNTLCVILASSFKCRGQSLPHNFGDIRYRQQLELENHHS